MSTPDARQDESALGAPASDLPILNPLVEDEDLPEDRRTVLITGASGNIGRKLREAWRETYDLVLIDARPDPDDPEVVVADLAEWDEEWVNLFYEADAVIHLAGNPNEFAAWDELVRPNMDALFNVFHASAQGGVERLIFASSNHAMGEYQPRAESPLTVDLPPRPDGPYGGLKLAGERLGISLARAYGLSFIGIRIGWVQRGENRPETMPHDWAVRMWLSNADLVRLFERAIEAELDEGEYAIVNGMSNNAGMRWSLAEAEARLGYRPQDGVAS